MSTPGITEERVAALEAVVAQIKAQLNGKRPGVIGRTNPQAIEEILSRSPRSVYGDAVWRSIEVAREQEREEVRREIREDGVS